MARKVRDRELGDRASRAKLKPRGKPYWRTLDQGVHIGYRKNPTAGGKWVGRVYRKGAAAPYLTHTLPGVADDKADADNRRCSRSTKRRTRCAHGPPSSTTGCRWRARWSAVQSINTRRTWGSAAAMPAT